VATPSQTDAPVLRHARLEDSARIAELCGQLGYPSTREQIERRLHEVVAHDGNAVAVAETSSGELAAVLDIFVVWGITSDMHAELAAFVVDERFRSQGVGRLLLAYAEDWAREKGCKEIALRSNVIRDRAHGFYENLGYRHIKTQKAFRKHL
jgi:GNAT superfamily N-acetyltransferase